MARVYRVTFENVTVSAAQDLVFIPGATGKIVRIVRRWVGSTDTTLPTNQQMQLRERFLPATVTAGTGGTTAVTPSKVDPGDATCSITTAGANNTGKATTSGTAVTLHEMGTNIYNGYEEIYLNPPIIGPSEAYVFELLSTVSGTVHMSGGVEFEEIGG